MTSEQFIQQQPRRQTLSAEPRPVTYYIPPPPGSRLDRVSYFLDHPIISTRRMLHNEMNLTRENARDARNLLRAAGRWARSDFDLGRRQLSYFFAPPTLKAEMLRGRDASTTNITSMPAASYFDTTGAVDMKTHEIRSVDEDPLLRIRKALAEIIAAGTEYVAENPRLEALVRKSKDLRLKQEATRTQKRGMVGEAFHNLRRNLEDKIMDIIEKREVDKRAAKAEEGPTIPIAPVPITPV